MKSSVIYPALSEQSLNKKRKRKKKYRKIYVRKKIKKKKSSKSFSNWPILYKIKKLYKKYQKNKKVIFTFICIKISVSILLLVLEIIL